MIRHLFVALASLCMIHSLASGEEKMEKQGSTAVHRAQWMHDGSFGIMVHYLIAPKGADDAARKAEFDRIVDGFRLDAFMRQFDETGADWLIFTLGQNTGYYCSPNAFLDQAMAGHTSKRDLALEIARAMKARKKRFVAYLPAEIAQQSDGMKKVFGWGQGDLSVFQERYGEFVRQYSIKFGAHCDGWWFDGCWEQPKRFGDWQAWMRACRAGNADLAVAVSPGPSARPMTQLQDFLAGETYGLPAPAPASRFVEGVQWHALLPIDSTFVGGKPNDFPDDVLFRWVQQCKAAGGAVTLNLPISNDGAMLEKSVAQIRRLARQLSAGK